MNTAMTLARAFLGLMALGWIAYGAWCFLEPGFLAGAAGVTAISTTGLVDLQATYGGLQMAIGAVLAGGALRPVFTRGALLGYGVVCAGIGSARLVAALLASEWSGYTAFAVGFELGCAALALLLLATARERAA